MSATPPRRMPLRRWRLVSRGLVMVAAIVLLGPFSDWQGGPALFSGLSPYVATGAIIADRSLHALAWLGLLVGLVVAVRRRFLCRWLCPTGLLLDGAGKLGCSCGRRPTGRGTVGAWLLWLTLGGAVFGLPLVLWLDPLAIFSAAASIPRPEAGLARWYAGAIISVLLLLDFSRPGSWCRQACPLGAFQDIAHDASRALVRRLRKTEQPPSENPRRTGMSRRAWLGLAGGGASAVALPMATGSTRPVLRPPGALDDPLFNGVCLRCGNCVRECPTGIIRNAGTEAGWLGLFSPTISFAGDYCREDCVRCTEVCPSGALRNISSVEKAHVRMGQPTITFDLCLLSDERECAECRNWCPFGAISYVFSDEDYLVHPKVDPDRCNGCGACEVHCPVNPVKAIRIEAAGRKQS